jgi:hypothetical protein
LTAIIPSKRRIHMNDQIALLTREQLRLKLNERGYPLTASYFNKISLPSVNGRCTQRPFGNTIVAGSPLLDGNNSVNRGDFT